MVRHINLDAISDSLTGQVEPFQFVFRLACQSMA
jgi:hypothetical protein